MIRKWAIAAGAVGLAALPLATAGTASATTSTWVRTQVSAGGCVAAQTVLEGYNGSSHEYQQGVVTAGGGNCLVQITQYINGNQGASSGWSPWQTPAYYDGPGYTDYICVFDTRTQASNCSSAY